MWQANIPFERLCKTITNLYCPLRRLKRLARKSTEYDLVHHTSKQTAAVMLKYMSINPN